MDSRQLVYDTLSGKNHGRAARHKWFLPWAWFYYEKEYKKLLEDFPDDIRQISGDLKIPTAAKGNLYENGDATDNFGCIFTNIQRGLIGEIKKPIVIKDDWSDYANVHIPEELLSFDIKSFNEKCAKNRDKFLLCDQLVRPFEQLQFIRGTENLYIDLMDIPPKMLLFIEKMHDFYKRLITKYAQTDIDAVFLMDDWGSQNSLLINPLLWERIFMPMYRDYSEIAHKYGKKVFMHSDGYILPIIPHLIEIGVDALNSQIFCMGINNLRQFKGKITFWGEIDRQYLLPKGTRQEIFDAVKSVKDSLWENGYCIAQCEFGAGANPDNVYGVYKAWDALTK